MGYRIVADDLIQVTPSLRRIADSLTLLPGDAIEPRHVADADMLLVRSITRVDSELLENSPVSWVGTATAGTDHLDLGFLHAKNIRWASAPGANARAVVEYVLSALAHMNFLPTLLSGEPIGIVGFGHVGGLLASVVHALGGSPRVWDPWVDVPASWRGDSFEQVLAAPIVSLHAALHERSPWPSVDLIDEPCAVCMQPGQLLINAGRGGLINPPALQTLADRGVQLVMDTWPGEPDIEARQLEVVALATPHIAGYSLTAKKRATDDVISLLVGGKSMPRITQVADNPDCGWAIDIADWLKGVLIEHYNPAVDDAALRAVASPNISSEDFERLRRTYVLRGELAGSRLRYRHRVDASMKRAAAALGFEFDNERVQ